ncbi:MAG TPA: hypothetical protein VKK31_25075 [Thermoanaerobaculia bacterium]|nr:hypothetical protein [Thermoanaerobaculia bacterium]
MKKRWLIALTLAAISSPLLASPQFGSPTESVGRYRSTEEKAVDAYGKGVKLKRKAEAEKDPEKRAKLYLKAKEELSKSIGYLANYDGYLALGQVYLALGNGESARDACAHARGLKPNNEAATSCIEAAQAMGKVAKQGEGDGGGR